jgi:hypothetical protein
MKERAGIDPELHRDRLGQSGVGRELGRLATADEDADRAAIVALVIEGAEDALVVAACGCEEAGRAIGRLGLTCEQVRGVADARFERAGGVGSERG